MINKNLPTKLFLNGPELSFTTQPGDVTTSSGIATFTGIATAGFPEGSTAVNDGSISFEWYFDGSKITDSAEGDIATVGTASTLTLTGLDSEDDLKQVYVVADYNPTAYSSPTGSDVTAGTARSTGNAFNEPIQSNAATITIDPKITIDTQPTDSVVAAGIDHTYTIAASVAPSGPTLSYQWQLDGTDLVDGVITSDVLGNATGEMTIVDDESGSTTLVDFSQVSVYNSFIVGRTYTVTVSGDIETSLELNGGGGGGSGFRNVEGSRGGKSTGKFTFLSGETYKIQVGSRGEDGANLTDDGNDTGEGGFPGGGAAPSLGSDFNRSGSGGGYTGLFIDSVTQANSILIAGGGGGSSGDPGTGGDGGGETGNAGSNRDGQDRGGAGGTQSAGGAAGTSGSAGTAGSALQGGRGTTSGNGAAGGGGGYFGGGGGASAGPGTGGGGSGFKHATLITDGVLTTGGAKNPEGDGSFTITLISTSGSEITTTSTTVRGATTPTLTINSETGGISGVVKCVVSALTDGTHASNSPLSSNEVNYSNLIPRDILNFEAYGTTSLATTKGYTMYEESDGKDVILSPTAIYQDNPNARVALTNFSSNDIAFYAPEKDVYLELEIRAGKGSNSASKSGGEGGYSKIRFTANKNDEYIIRGLESSSAIFLYRRANLIAVVGEGGSAARFSDGGNGGGILQAGQNSGGTGGAKIADGALGENGTWGGRANPSEVYLEDGQSSGTAAGQTIKCSKGVYWRDQGVSACADLNSATAASIPASGLSQFRLSDGTIVTNSGEINRGFKAGYAINSTGGSGNTDGSGKGGHGATGGRGDTGGNGGGGGSGYTDGSLTYVVESTLGGNNGDAGVILRLASTATDPVPVPPPPEERIVRWSVSRNAGDSNTVTFSKESGIGPSSITWGPNTSNVDTLIGSGAVYVFSSDTHSGGRGLNRRLTGNTLEMDDVGDNDYNDLTVTPNQGRFTSDSRWEANW